MCRKTPSLQGWGVSKGDVIINIEELVDKAGELNTTVKAKTKEVVL